MGSELETVGGGFGAGSVEIGVEVVVSVEEVGISRLEIEVLRL